jgi:hypothetical protein
MLENAEVERRWNMSLGKYEFGADPGQLKVYAGETIFPPKASDRKFFSPPS